MGGNEIFVKLLILDYHPSSLKRLDKKFSKDLSQRQLSTDKTEMFSVLSIAMKTAEE